ncbi:hypothetical protein HAX54_046014 [Datura stramonium]|uniref:Uncharacterized protein n=1 Tax=Datura stramonium TaxID=4076 RepID=A0ABS8SRA4_DATST|nr:hypothetical protein [Datura stramonium]
MDSDKEGKGGTATPIAESDSEIEHEPGERNSWVHNALSKNTQKDKDDESLRRWKEQLLGSVDINSVGESLDPDVKILSLEIKLCTKQMIGAFSPQSEPYTHEMPEETTPSGMFARGSYSAKTKF